MYIYRSIPACDEDYFIPLIINGFAMEFELFWGFRQLKAYSRIQHSYSGF
jgi:hypothetical protein